MATSKKPKGEAAPTAGATRPSYNLDPDAVEAQLKRPSLFYNWEDGPNIIRVLPRFDGHPSPFVVSWLHYKMLREDKQGTFAPGCLNHHSTDDTSCYICRVLDWIKAHGLWDDECDGMTASRKLTAQILVQNKATREWSGPFLAEIKGGPANTMQSWMAAARVTGTPMFADVDHGTAVVINKSGKGFGTRYEATQVPRPESLDIIFPGWETKVIQDPVTKLDVKVLTSAEQAEVLHRTKPEWPWEEILKEVAP